MTNQIWITRDYLKCTGCRRCEIACSLHHEDWIWPEASRIRVFMPFPGVEVPHFCAQCQDYARAHAKGVTGFPISRKSWRTDQGPRIVALQRALLLIGGPDLFWKPVEDDDNPPRFYEPLPSGPYKGLTTNKAVVEEKRAAYFETLGWDERGIPTKETLDRLGLGDIDPSMNKLRK